ncbi:MAG: hypothetical protein A2Z29_11270 [Chloroflexi bacterium RBG_16_56_11]|nr:MAG: hypothetical protein A2Z29_11270 [Chloroflexi bacterium RBG_16_56_11]
MKKLIIIIFIFVVTLNGASGCTQPTTPQPPATTPADFNLIFKYGITARNTLDTFQGMYTKDMILDPAITVELSLTQEEMDKIYQKMREIDFFSYPVKFAVGAGPGEPVSEVTPYSTYFFKVTYDGHTRELLWDDKIIKKDEKADRLRELIEFIRGMVEAREEYKKLPEPRGGYL